MLIASTKMTRVVDPTRPMQSNGPKPRYGPLVPIPEQSRTVPVDGFRFFFRCGWRHSLTAKGIVRRPLQLLLTDGTTVSQCNLAIQEKTQEMPVIEPCSQDVNARTPNR